MNTMYKLTFYVPNTHIDTVKNALFAVGAGKVGNYSHCAWQVLGTGQFKPLDGATPYIGHANRLETVLEWRVEILFDTPLLSQVIQTLKTAHPYETPAYDVIEVMV